MNNMKQNSYTLLESFSDFEYEAVLQKLRDAGIPAVSKDFGNPVARSHAAHSPDGRQIWVAQSRINEAKALLRISNRKILHFKQRKSVWVIMVSVFLLTFIFVIIFMGIFIKVLLS